MKVVAEQLFSKPQTAKGLMRSGARQAQRALYIRRKSTQIPSAGRGDGNAGAQEEVPDRVQGVDEEF